MTRIAMLDGSGLRLIAATSKVRDDDVLRLFASASTLQGIAEQLSLEYEEVVRVKEAAMRKLGFTSRLQAMHYVRSRNPDTPT